MCLECGFEWNSKFCIKIHQNSSSFLLFMEIAQVSVEALENWIRRNKTWNTNFTMLQKNHPQTLHLGHPTEPTKSFIFMKGVSRNNLNYILYNFLVKINLSKMCVHPLHLVFFMIIKYWKLRQTSKCSASGGTLMKTLHSKIFNW
jgi:hypothetical protein